MGRFKVYIKPFTTEGIYEDEWRDVTDDADLAGISTIKQSLDNNEYDVGIFKTSGLGLSLVNIDGRYSDVGVPGSIFNFRRSNSLVRITWEIMDHDVICGFFICGNVALSDEVVAFEGFLDDTALKQDADAQDLKFKVLGKESIFTQVAVPYDDIADGDSIEELIFICLSQQVITDQLTVDLANIDCSANPFSNSVVDLENKTVMEALQELLRISNSVLYLINNVVYVSPRNASPTDKFTFFGQGSSVGNENIIDLTDYRTGLNRVYNFITWADSPLVKSDLTSIERNGLQKKQVGSKVITYEPSQELILENILLEFRNAKREMTIRAPIDYDTIALNVLDKVAVDYPNISISDTGSIPLWDLATWDVAKFPYEVLPITIESGARFKILSKDIDTQNHEMVFLLREV